MKKAVVYFTPFTAKNRKNVGEIALKLFGKIVKDNNIKLEKNLPLKIHTGEPGNITFIKPENYDPLIDYLKKQGIKPFYIETNTATGVRSKKKTHLKVAKQHGFTQIPIVIADGEDGKDHILVKIDNGKYFSECRITTELANKSQIVVLSHFKGHIDAGFGGAIKMLGIGFASGQGKMEVHSKNYLSNQKTIEWDKVDKQFHGEIFRERIAEYALAAVNHKQYIYLTFAMDMTENCDCDGEEMQPVYKDLGVFSSLDPVAIDKACFDLLKSREGKIPFAGEHVFPYAEKISLGNQKYSLRVQKV